MRPGFVYDTGGSPLNGNVARKPALTFSQPLHLSPSSALWKGLASSSQSMSLTQNTLHWHDYETFGLDSAHDRPVHFAGIRTDEDLNIVV